MVGKYQGDFDLFGSGAIAAELKRQLGGKLEVLRRNLQVGSPLRREGDVYYLSGNAPHRGGEDQAYILFDAGHRAPPVTSDARRVGTECVSTCRSRWWEDT